MIKFSQEITHWLRTSKRKTIYELNDMFDEKSFAVALLLLLFPSALPLPTGGVTNLLEIIAMIVCLQLIAGRDRIWLPKRWKNVSIGEFATSKMLPWFVRLLKWAERVSRHNLPDFPHRRSTKVMLGFVLIIFILGSFLSPPFAGLDTLPSAAVVLIALSMLVEDRKLLIGGIVMGIVGLGVVFWSWRLLSIWIFNIF